MTLFLSTMGRMGYLFSFILLGFFLSKWRALPESTSQVISKLENNLLIPAMVLNTFLRRFTAQTFHTAYRVLLAGALTLLLSIPFALVFGKMLSRREEMKRIYAFGLSFSNFAFMGYAVVNALFPEIYFEYLIFTLPLWAGVYLWGVPELLMPRGEKRSFAGRAKNFLNPMFCCMILGMILGLCGVEKYLPQWSLDVIGAAEGCMAPLAMILTGVTLAFVDLKKVFSSAGIYAFSFLRLLAFPGVFLLLGKIFHLEGTPFLCAFCFLAMPASVNTVVIPSFYGTDTSLAAGMVLTSHLFSCVTIPILFSLL